MTEFEDTAKVVEPDTAINPQRMLAAECFVCETFDPLRLEQGIALGPAISDVPGTGPEVWIVCKADVLHAGLPTARFPKCVVIAKDRGVDDSPFGSSHAASPFLA